MKKILLIALAALTAAGAWAVPAKKLKRTYIQPDGRVVTVVKTGDEKSHISCSTDGKLLIFDKKQGYCYANVDNNGKIVSTGVAAADAGLRSEAESNILKNIDSQVLSSAIEARRANSRMVKLPMPVRGAKSVTRGPGLFSNDFPVKGDIKALVLLVEFQDVKFNSKNVAPNKPADGATYFKELLNKKGFDTFGGTGSAKDYFEYNSQNVFRPQFDVYGPVTLPQNCAYYGKNDSNGDDAKATQAVIDACKLLDSQINFKDYDMNGDGYVDNVYVFYAGYGEADIYEDDEAEMNVIWPHAWTISAYNAPNDYSLGSPLILDGVKIDSYGMSNETIGIEDVEKEEYANRPDGVGTFVHEFSHIMGIPDLYDTTEGYRIYKDVPFTPGAFSVMDYGPYNNGGKTPPNYSMYERYALDWVTPLEFSETGNYTLKNLGDSNEGYIVKTDKANEFYLFENRQQTGWDKYLPGHGMLVWHVDYNSTVFNNGEVNNTKNHQYVDLVEADNIQDGPIGEGWFDYEYGPDTQTGDPFPGTKNVTNFSFTTKPALKSWSGKDLGVSFSEIAETSGNISLVATLGLGGGSNSGGAIYSGLGEDETTIDWTLDVENTGTLTGVWKWMTYNGLQYLNASGYVGGKNNACESYAVSPVISLEGYKNASFSFEHAAKFQTTLKDLCYPVVREAGSKTWTKLAITTWPGTASWTFVNAGTIDLTAFVGKKIELGFHYGSTTTGADKWEIKNVVVTGEVSTGVAEIEETNAPVEYYNLQGVKVANPERGVYVRRQGSKVEKILVR